jgi:hypothetical protein
MNDFPYLLVRAVRGLGTVLDVALALNVQPSQVHRWIAGVELPPKERVGEYQACLEALCAGRRAA